MRWKAGRRSENVEDRRGMPVRRGGLGQSAMGPFYCPGDRKVYIDLAFYRELRERFRAPGDFARAYVIAHEVGHHVQNLLGTSAQVQRQRRAVGDDRLQQQGGYVTPESFMHGSPAQRVRGFRHGLETGDPGRCDTFGADEI